MAGHVAGSGASGFTVCFPDGEGGELTIAAFAEAAQAEQALRLLRLHCALRNGDEAAVSQQTGLQVCTGRPPKPTRHCAACCQPPPPPPLPVPAACGQNVATCLPPLVQASDAEGCCDEATLEELRSTSLEDFVQLLQLTAAEEAEPSAVAEDDASGGAAGLPTAASAAHSPGVPDAAKHGSDSVLADAAPLPGAGASASLPPPFPTAAAAAAAAAAAGAGAASVPAASGAVAGAAAGAAVGAVAGAAAGAASGAIFGAAAGAAAGAVAGAAATEAGVKAEPQPEVQEQLCVAAPLLAATAPEPAAIAAAAATTAAATAAAATAGAGVALPAAPQEGQQPHPQQPPLQQPQPAGQQAFQHFFGVFPRQPSPSVDTYKASISCGLELGGRVRRGGKGARAVTVAACPTPGEAAVARDLATLWKEHHSRAAAQQQQQPEQQQPEQQQQEQQQQQQEINFDRAR